MAYEYTRSPSFIINTTDVPTVKSYVPFIHNRSEAESSRSQLQNSDYENNTSISMLAEEEEEEEEEEQELMPEFDENAARNLERVYILPPPGKGSVAMQKAYFNLFSICCLQMLEQTKAINSAISSITSSCASNANTPNANIVLQSGNNTMLSQVPPSTPATLLHPPPAPPPLKPRTANQLYQLLMRSPVPHT
jgi:hypothetical protein